MVATITVEVNRIVAQVGRQDLGHGRLWNRNSGTVSACRLIHTCGQGRRCSQLLTPGAIVVGGGSGIGRGIAHALSSNGVRTIISDIDSDSASTVAEAIVRCGGRATAVQIDATNPEALHQLSTQIAEKHGSLHIVVSAVGVYASASVTTTDEKVWAWFTQFHLMSTVRVVGAFLPVLQAHNEGGHIVITSSISGLLALQPAATTDASNSGVYTVLKHALVGYGQMLCGELASDNVGVSVLYIPEQFSATYTRRPRGIGPSDLGA